MVETVLHGRTAPRDHMVATLLISGLSGDPAKSTAQALKETNAESAGKKG